MIVQVVESTSKLPLALFMVIVALVVFVYVY